MPPNAAHTPAHVDLARLLERLAGPTPPPLLTNAIERLLLVRQLSAAFDLHRAAIREETADWPARAREAALDEPERYIRAGGYWLPRDARWSRISSAERPAEALEETLRALEGVNRSLAGISSSLPATQISHADLRAVISLLSDAHQVVNSGRSLADALADTYDYWVHHRARSEGRRGGEFYTPPSVSLLVTELLGPTAGRVYDPCCGSGGMLLQATRFAAAHGGHPGRDLTLWGQEVNLRARATAIMRLAVHGSRPANLSHADTLAADDLPDLVADFVLAHPPFNVGDWGRDPTDPRWRYGVPPETNANFAWLQHVIAKMAAQGTAAVVLANGSMSTAHTHEAPLRAAIVEDDLVACMVALPDRLFTNTPIPACIWILAQDKGPGGKAQQADRRGQVLFIDARALGEMAGRHERVLSDNSIARIASTYRSWRQPPPPTDTDPTGRGEGTADGYQDVAGFCRSVPLEEIRQHKHILTPGRYVGQPQETAPRATEPDDSVIVSLTRDFLALLDDADLLADTLREHLDGSSGTAST